MDRNNGTLRSGIIRNVHEVLLSLNVSFAIMSVVELELEAHRGIAPFFWLEFSINKLLHIRQTDFIRGYIAFAVSSVALALCFWLALRLSAGAEVTRRILPSLARPVVLAPPFGVWLYMYQKHGWPFS